MNRNFTHAWTECFFTLKKNVKLLAYSDLSQQLTKNAPNCSGSKAIFGQFFGRPILHQSKWNSTHVFSTYSSMSTIYFKPVDALHCAQPCVKNGPNRSDANKQKPFSTNFLDGQFCTNPSEIRHTCSWPTRLRARFISSRWMRYIAHSRAAKTVKK